MKRTLVALAVMLVVSSVAFAFPIAKGSLLEVVPGGQVGAFYSLANKDTTSGIMANMLRYKVLDLNLGAIDKNGKGVLVGSLSVAIDRIPFKNVQYMWDGILKVSVGLWAGYDFDNCVWDYGMNASIIKIEI